MRKWDSPKFDPAREERAKLLNLLQSKKLPHAATMKRKAFLKRLGLLGAAIAGPAIGLSKAKEIMDEPSNQELLESSCTTAPDETAGPYPAPSSVSTTSLVRSNITEGSQTGIPLSLTFTIVNSQNNCLPVSGLRVDIWHCNKRGYYSAYDGQPGIDGTVNNAGTTWLRGIQYTDSNGQVSFTTIYPGWYTPRATHIHVQVFDANNTLLCTTQLAFPDANNTAVNAYYATSGTNSFTNSNDMVFSDSYSDELMTVSGSTANGYTATKQIAIAAGTLGVESIAAETGGQFSKLAASPNPFIFQSTISFELVQPSDVAITVMDMLGQTVAQMPKLSCAAGANQWQLDGTALAAGIYIYQIEVSNYNGTYRQSKQIVKY